MNPEPDHQQRGAKAAAGLIYVAEDDPYLRDLAGLLLSSEDYVYEAFPNAERALEAFHTADPKPRLIISDYSMGKFGISGVDFLKECKRLNPGIKGFLVSGTVDERVIKVDGQPVDRFLSKPFNNDDFLGVVRELMQ